MSRVRPDYGAVRHLLTSDAIAVRTAPYIGADNFDWNGLLSEAQTMSGGERVLVRIAYDLWEAEGLVGVWEIARRLDRRSFERVIDALAISRGDLPAEAERLRDAA
jgi:hypothetical protein